MNRPTPLQPRPKLCYSCILYGHIARLRPKLAILDEHENAEGEEDEYNSAKDEEEWW